MTRYHAYLLSLLTIGISISNANAELIQNVNQSFPRTSEHQMIFDSISEQDLDQCRKSAHSCYECVKTCPVKLNSRKAREHKDRLKQANAVSEVDECQAKYLELSAGLPNWCFNVADNFQTSKTFVPTEDVCGLIDKRKCTERWLNDMQNDVDEGKLKRSSLQFRLAKKAVEYATLLDAIEVEKMRLERIPLLVKQYSNERRTHSIGQAKSFLSNTAIRGNKYSSPAFVDIHKVKANTRKLDLKVSRSDERMVLFQNEVMKDRTVEKIPKIVEDIKKMKRKFRFNAHQADKDLKQIRNIMDKTKQLQDETAELVYETSHSKDAEGEIRILDRELLNIYEKIGRQRKLLSETNTHATDAKAELLKIMRDLVKEISEQQAKMKCHDNEVMLK